MKLKNIKLPDGFAVFVHTLRDGGVYTAICLNLSLFAEADTEREALNALSEQVRDYLEFVDEHHKGEAGMYLDRPVPLEYLMESVG